MGTTTKSRCPRVDLAEPVAFVVVVVVGAGDVVVSEIRVVAVAGMMQQFHHCQKGCHHHQI